MKRLNSIYFYAFTILILFGFVPIQETNLFFKETGNGETIIFVHGSQEDYRAFIPQFELLGKEFHVITYSRRYNYPNEHSYKKETPFNPMTEAEDLEKLRQQMGIEEFNIVGHSYGGLVALAYANKYQNRLKSITVSEPPVLSIKGCDESLSYTEKGLIEKLKASFKTKDTTVVMKAIFEFFVGKDIQNQIPPEALQALKSNLPEMEALANSENPFPNLNTTFDFPTMIITSENVMPILMCTNESLIRITPNAKHVRIPSASHDMWMTHPTVMSSHLKDFILNE
ncbi:alpha/beta hydrolase [Allomuricauda sp. d1]|uniref:alpha/beta fold hydrolase n=1 Tax=Allomuricauda sp. d1 TaxID=3136725 RepID=UPI0031DF0594